MGRQQKVVKEDEGEKKKNNIHFRVFFNSFFFHTEVKIRSTLFFCTYNIIYPHQKQNCITSTVDSR